MTKHLRITLATLVATVAIGCQSAPPPTHDPTQHGLGSAVRMHLDRQVNRGAASDFVIHQHEWFLGGTELGPAGRRHISRLQSRLTREAHQVIIEPADPDLKVHAGIKDAALAAQELDQTRRFEVIQMLFQCGIPDAEMRVRIAYPQAEGLDGAQATRIFNSLGRGGLGGQGGTGVGGVGGFTGGAGGRF